MGTQGGDNFNAFAQQRSDGLILPMRSTMAILAPCSGHSILQASGKCPLIIPSADISVTMFYQMIAGSFQHNDTGASRC